MKRQLDVVREFALVVYVAGVAVGTGRQLVERDDRRLADLTAGTEQVPAHGQQTVPHRLETGLDRVPFRYLPPPRQRHGTDRHQIHLLPVEHVVGNPRGKAVPVGRRIDLLDQRIDPGTHRARKRRRGRLRIPAQRRPRCMRARTAPARRTAVRRRERTQSIPVCAPPNHALPYSPCTRTGCPRPSAAVAAPRAATARGHW